MGGRVISGDVDEVFARGRAGGMRCDACPGAPSRVRTAAESSSGSCRGLLVRVRAKTRFGAGEWESASVTPAPAPP
ncbi:hypothetical protein Skr01_08870 [Sphaerisporangium krabiense]|nr:hypothetical protein Skr01_08870 [Sphaerisporangium krabiense]